MPKLTLLALLSLYARLTLTDAVKPVLSVKRSHVNSRAVAQKLDLKSSQTLTP